MSPPLWNSLVQELPSQSCPFPPLIFWIASTNSVDFLSLVSFQIHLLLSIHAATILVKAAAFLHRNKKQLVIWCTWSHSYSDSCCSSPWNFLMTSFCFSEKVQYCECYLPVLARSYIVFFTSSHMLFFFLSLIMWFPLLRRLPFPIVDNILTSFSAELKLYLNVIFFKNYQTSEGALNFPCIAVITIMRIKLVHNYVKSVSLTKM